MNARYRFTDGNAMLWRKSTVAEGVDVKDLGTVHGRSMQLVRCAAETRFAAHIQEGLEFVHMLEGEAVQHGQRLGPGWGQPPKQRRRMRTSTVRQVAPFRL